ncbi:uncharacterized protein J7T54_003553 [Emericellopsis cladophorae]|uniref:SAM-dependent methyltransferase n=1 Tax=Emericellopsis cladophorae TaxID=2686198 RepID=A0A9Q0BEK6_9HYPO|nr:uncharacterized protein J7T54_003553 [Emericellopsis cladophorae]KAI6782542.1 hypothetical protein J7T54_003553 [Emericellopsis cladophorae]
MSNTLTHMMYTQADAASIARLSLHDPVQFAVQEAQILHRLALLQAWNIRAGLKILELGCALCTLGQAQHHLSQGLLSRQITWVQQSPLDYLCSLSSPLDTQGNTFDATVLAHSLWYVASPSLILSTFRAIKQHSKRLLLAEWSLFATQPSARPCILAALTQASLECRKESSASNVHTVLEPKRLTELALAAGWQLEKETLVEPGNGLLDGR